MNNINEVVATQNANDEVKVFVIKKLYSNDVEDILNGKEVHLLKNKIIAKLTAPNLITIKDSLFNENYEIAIDSSCEKEDIADNINNVTIKKYGCRAHSFEFSGSYIKFKSKDYQEYCLKMFREGKERNIGRNKFEIGKVNIYNVLDIMLGTELKLPGGRITYTKIHNIYGHDCDLCFNTSISQIEQVADTAQNIIIIKDTHLNLTEECYYTNDNFNPYDLYNMADNISDIIECMYLYSGYEVVDCGVYWEFVE